MKHNLDLATVGGGCFWCTEAIFAEVEGVETVVSGYSGGNVPGHPTYKEVCSGLTGHAEVVQINFDPKRITYKELLLIFMTTHDRDFMNNVCKKTIEISHKKVTTYSGNYDFYLQEKEIRL